MKREQSPEPARRPADVPTDPSPPAARRTDAQPVEAPLSLDGRGELGPGVGRAPRTRSRGSQAAPALQQESRARLRAEAELRLVEARLRAVVAHLPVGLIVADLDARRLHWNPHALAMHRYGPGEDEARVLATLMAAHELRTLDGEAIPADRWPLQRLLRGERFEAQEFVVRSRRLGWERIFCYTGVVVPDVQPPVGLLVMQDVTERKHAEQQVRDDDRRKTEFLAVLSHELRNPLAPLRHALAVLDRVDPAGPQAARARQIANRQVQQLARLVDDLLDVTRIARGRIALLRATVDLAELVRRTVDDHRALLRDRGLTLELATPADPLPLDADEARIAQVVANLLQNAAKFTPAGGHVAVEVARDGPWAVVQVRDTGRGIEQALLEAMFEPFVQAPQTLARSDGGLGLGLALVRGLVRLHGGEVQAASGGAGRGTVFTVRLPAA